MKSLKAAAAVAGSLAVGGIAAPAFAADSSHTTPTGINGALETITSQKSLDVHPFAHQSHSLDTENTNSALSTVKRATTTLNQQSAPARLLGGLPVRGR
ncbi:hypothetical protein [Streptomyces sp. NPDC101149]|uniref:hypothetical protein n=1 Tax=Streptomyces sp. NPDC101149 TaxID=3366113 RepID=UPI0038216B98